MKYYLDLLTQRTKNLLVVATVVLVMASTWIITHGQCLSLLCGTVKLFQHASMIIIVLFTADFCRFYFSKSKY